MAARLIAHLAAWYIPNGQPTASGMEGLTIDGGYRLEAQRMHAELEARARGQMREFIDRIFDRLSEAGVDDAETTQQYRDWRQSDG